MDANSITSDANRTINLEVEDREKYRHWCPQSEKFAGGDALLTALEDGWQIIGVIFRQDFWHAGVRRAPVYQFNLSRGDEVMKMAFVQNPYVMRFVSECSVQVILMNQRKQIGQECW